jgi:hypothetical protein
MSYAEAFKRWTEQIRGGTPETAPTDPNAALNARLDKIETMLATQSETAAKNATAAASKQRADAWQEKLGTVLQDPKYAAIRALNAQNEVVQLVADYYQTHSVVLTPSQAADMILPHAAKRAAEVASSMGYAKQPTVENPPPPPAPQVATPAPALPGPQTLSQDATQRTVSVDLLEERSGTFQEEVQRAARAMRQQ